MLKPTFFARRLIFAVLVFWVCLAGCLYGAGGTGPEEGFPTPLESYADAQVQGVGAKLLGRIQADPFNLVATLIFFAAIVHTFLAAKFRAVSHRFEVECERMTAGGGAADLRQLDRKKFLSVVFHFLGEVEAVFGIWLIPLGLAILVMKGQGVASHYLSGVNFTEPIFVVVIMAIASSRPILQFAEGSLKKFADFGGGSPAAWWFAILTIGPLLGSFITEPAAMTICALLLAGKFYKLNPSMNLRYVTLGLLFVHISIGGTLTHFAAPPVVMVAGKWNWDTPFMLVHFGWKAAACILISNTLAFMVFRRELLSMKAAVSTGRDKIGAVPVPIILCHLLFIGFVVYTAHYAAMVVVTFMFFMAFVAATERNQDAISLRGPVLVGFFLAGLVIHGGCQQWWIEPVLTSLNPTQLLLGSTVLTAFNDNAAITYLASLVPGFSDQAKLAVVAGAVAGGGLTVIANAPNPAGQSILQSYFGENGVSALKLFLAALIPTAICVAVFLLLL
ncbi:MAG: putative Na+/H+ antiporter [Verrucomicrobia bacterium]|nr:putative Na+/H+ antiporter [Verrucomicrobiota bacterium]